MRYQCAMCNLVRDTRTERKYVYMNSQKSVRVLVCSSCHNQKVSDMRAAAEKFVDQHIVLGVLRAAPPSYTE